MKRCHTICQVRATTRTLVFARVVHSLPFVFSPVAPASSLSPHRPLAPAPRRLQTPPRGARRMSRLMMMPSQSMNMLRKVFKFGAPQFDKNEGDPEDPPKGGSGGNGGNGSG